MRISIGSDHHGISIRQKLVEFIKQIGHSVIEQANSDEKNSSVDYPDVAVRVSCDVSAGNADRGVLICGTGIGMCITANKFPGVRAATILDELTAEISRRHNDLNVICFSGDMLSEKTVCRLLEIWLNIPFDGGRHQRRLDEISKIEQILSAGGNVDDVLKSIAKNGSIEC
jgi:ribose 5-phosphate isomerase B